ncbi:MAG: IPT/TIG domain-containing protein [Pseudomonadota bacterium]|nr:IPT/TIG domain-containing protein [Pseudomonadota bacterium]
MIFALLLSGCGAFGLTNSAGQDPGGEGDLALAIDSLDPAWGLPSEATAVTIAGPGVGSATSVKFGNSEVDFTVLDDTTVVATAPAPGFETVVDVRVVGTAGADTLEGGFAYTSDAPADDTGDTEDTEDSPGAGKTGGLVQLSLVQVACPECVGLTSSLDVSAQAAFHEPTRDGWLEWLPAEGNCVTDAASTAPAETFLDAGEWVYLTSGSRSIGLRGATDGIYAADGLDELDFVRNAAYDLSAPAGGADLPSFDVLDALTTPQAISSLTPEAILYTTPRDAFTARISRSGAAFTWGPAGGSGTFLVVLSIYNAAGTAFLGEVTCRGADNGAMTVPSSVVGSYPTGSLVVVGMHRYTIGSFLRPDDGSTVDTVASFGVLGTGSLSP